MQQQITTALLTANEIRLTQGEIITFGKISISPSGLFFKRNHLPWSDVAWIGVNIGYLVVNKKSGSQLNYVVHRSMETVVGVLSRIMGGIAQPMTGGKQMIQWKKILANEILNIYLLITLANVLMKKSGMLGNAPIEVLKRSPESQTASTSSAIPAAVESTSFNYEEFHSLYPPP